MSAARVPRRRSRCGSPTGARASRTTSASGCSRRSIAATRRPSGPGAVSGSRSREADRRGARRADLDRGRARRRHGRGVRAPGGRRRPREGAGRRRRAADPPRPAHEPGGARLRGHDGGDGRGRRARRRGDRRPTWSCSTSACPTSTAPRSIAARPRVLRGPGRSCCRCARVSTTRSPRSTPAPTTTSRSRSRWRSCWPGRAPRSGARLPEEPDAPRPARSATLEVDLARRLVTRDGEARPPDADRVRAAGGARDEPGQAPHAPMAAAQGLGTGVRDRDHVPAHLRPRAPEEAGRRRRPRPALILTEPGVGYRWVATASSVPPEQARSRRRPHGDEGSHAPVPARASSSGSWSAGRSRATGWSTRCCRRSSRCRCSPPTRCPRSRTRPRRSCACSCVASVGTVALRRCRSRSRSRRC